MPKLLIILRSYVYARSFSEAESYSVVPVLSGKYTWDPELANGTNGKQTASAVKSHTPTSQRGITNFNVAVEVRRNIDRTACSCTRL